MRALAILLIMLLSGCALPPNDSLLAPAPSNKPTPQDTVVELSNKIKALCLEPVYAAYFAKTFCTLGLRLTTNWLRNLTKHCH